jgi:Tfp pilus assembly protein PilP
MATPKKRNREIWGSASWAGTVLCCLLLLALPSTGESVPSGQSAPAQSQTSQEGVTPQPSPNVTPGSVSVQSSLMPTTKPGDPALEEKIKESLLRETFIYTPNEMADPFKSLITPLELTPTASLAPEEDTALAPEPQRPLTPLQKMSVAEIERGLRAISWGELGRRAVIEDAAGKGYIVSVGTPAAERNGVITEIFNDRLVIQQQLWDKKQKRMIPENSIVKLMKLKEK